MILFIVDKIKFVKWNLYPLSIYPHLFSHYSFLLLVWQINISKKKYEWKIIFDYLNASLINAL